MAREHRVRGEGQGQIIDITDRVNVYEKGKTFKCPCGQGIGVPLEQEFVQCATCNAMLVDKKSNDREPNQQTTLGAFK